MAKKEFYFDSESMYESIIATTQKGNVGPDSEENIEAAKEEEQIIAPQIEKKRTRGRPKAINTQKKRNFNIRIPEDILMKLTGIAGDIQAETRKRTTVSDIICSAINDFIAKKEEAKSK